MENETIEKVYWANQVADSLGISTSTLRKYCLILENAGYEFLRGENKRRAFIQKDVITLTQLQAASKKKNVTLENAAESILFKQSIRVEGLNSVIGENRSNKGYAVLQSVIGQLLEQNKSLCQQLNIIITEVATTKEKMDEFITETRAERQQKKKTVWKWFGN